MNETPLVHLDRVFLRFGDKPVLDGLRPTSGDVRYKHLRIHRLSRSKLNLLRSRIGMVYQYSALISSLNVRDNLALPVEELGRKSPKEIDQLVEEKLAVVGMGGTEDKMPSELSGGMRKRVSLARALMMDPELVLFDEPSAGLDPVMSSVIDELIISLTEKTSSTSVIVTHEMDSAFRIATRMAMLYQGTIIQDDAPESFRNAENPVVRQFVTGEVVGPITETVENADPS